jgi:hypothetical protein
MSSLFKLLITLSLSAVLSTAAFAEKIHFNLHTQHFSETLKQKRIVAKYELPDSYVSTNLNRGSTYTTTDDNGYFNVELKKPLANWGISFDMRYDFSSHYNETRSIRLIANNGTSLTLTLQYNNVVFDGAKVYSASYSRPRIAIDISKDSSNTVKLSINGLKVASSTHAEFTNLKFVQLQLIHESGNDALNDLIIGER